MFISNRITVCCLIGLLAAGCGNSSLIKARGRIIKQGQTYVPPEGEGLRIFFAPLDSPNRTHYDSYAAVYDPDAGTFQVMGKDGAGLPRGKYRIDLQLMKQKEDLLGGALLGKRSPFTCEVTGNRDDIVVDLDRANFDNLLARATQPKKVRRRN